MKAAEVNYWYYWW